MKISNRKSVYANLNKFCCIAKDEDYIEITEWTNGEGWDISFKDTILSLTRGELEAIQYLTKSLEVGE